MQSVAKVVAAQSSWLEDLQQVTAAQIKLTDWVVGQNAGVGLLGELSGKPLSSWQDYVGVAPVEPGVEWLRTSVAAGSATLGLLGADVLDPDLEEDALVQATVEHVELDVLAVSEPGRLRAARELYARLGLLDPAVPEHLEGAWDDIERNGPAAVSKAANCIVEVLDRTLRAAAPEAAVLAWRTTWPGRSTEDLTEKGKPTRQLRVKYLAAQVGGTRKLVVAQYEGLAGLLKPFYERLQVSPDPEN